MNLFTALLFTILVLVTSVSHVYFIWKKKEHKTLAIQLGIIGMAIIGGVLVIYEIQNFLSISRLLNFLSPL
jgi:hypothetical protein